MSDILGRIKSGAGKVAKEADRVTHVKRIELDIGSIKKQIEDQYNKLGEIAYKSSVNNEPENPEAMGIIAKITELLQQIKAKEEEIKRINQGEAEPQPEQATPATQPPAPQAPATQAPATPEKRFCTSCGRENDTSAKFCAECGAKMG
jgi:cell division septation protein DedD